MTLANRTNWWERLRNNRGEVALPVDDPDDEGTPVTVDDPSQTPSDKAHLSKENKESTEPVRSDADKRAPESEGDKRWKAVENQLSASRRVTETLQRELSQVRQALAQRPPVAAPPPSTGRDALPAGTDQETVDKYDKLMLDGDWQGAVRLLAREEAVHVTRTRDLEESQRQREAKRLDTLEKNKEAVRQKYAALREDVEDTNAPEWNLYNEAVNQLSTEDPDFLGNPYSPTLAMSRMEQLARERGVPLSASRTPAHPPQPSGARRPAPRALANSNLYTITKEQKEWADRYLSHLPTDQRYKHYASYAKRNESDGEVSAE